jgi:hypothetical protein
MIDISAPRLSLFSAQFVNHYGGARRAGEIFFIPPLFCSLVGETENMILLIFLASW